jgi:hypothetical protein
LGSDLSHPLLEIADEIFLVAKIGFNTLARLQELNLTPSALILNFSERSKIQQKWRAQISEHYPRLKVVNIPWDLKSFESAAESKSALIECSPNSLARKSIATSCLMRVYVATTAEQIKLLLKSTVTFEEYLTP